MGLIPCNMVSEIQTEDDEMMEQLLKQGFLPLNTPVEKLGEPAPLGVEALTGSSSRGLLLTISDSEETCSYNV